MNKGRECVRLASHQHPRPFAAPCLLTGTACLTGSGENVRMALASCASSARPISVSGFGILSQRPIRPSSLCGIGAGRNLWRLALLAAHFSAYIPYRISCSVCAFRFWRQPRSGYCAYIRSADYCDVICLVRSGSRNVLIGSWITHRGACDVGTR